MNRSPDSPHFKPNVAWKDSVEMGADDERLRMQARGIFSGLTIGNDDVSKSVVKRCKPYRAQRLQKMTAPLSFFERRSRYERQTNLIRFDFTLSIFEDLKGSANASIGKD